MTTDIRQQFADTMLELGQQDPNLVVLVSDISHFKLQPFAHACPLRFYNIGICEPSIVSLSAGLAKMGFKTVTHTITPFLIERAFEQIKLDFCYQQLGGNLVSVGSAFDYAALGCTHHCYYDFGILRNLPHVNLFYPSSPVEFEVLFKSVYANGQLNYFRIPAYSHGVSFERKNIKVGQTVLVQEGKDLTIVVTGPQLKNVRKACDELEQKKMSIEIIYVHTIEPLDKYSIVQSVRKTRRLLVVEEHLFQGGIGQQLLMELKEIPDVVCECLCIPLEFIRDYGTYEDLCQKVNLTPQGIVKSVLTKVIR